MIRLLRLVLTAPLIFMVICLIWLFSTEEGTVFLASLANKLLPELQIDNIDGYVFGTLQAGRVEWRDEWGEVSVTELRFNWGPSCLLNTELCIDELQAKQLNVAVLTQSDEPEGALPEIEMPLGINVSSAKIDGFNLKIGENEHKITNIALTGEWVDSLLALDTLEIEYQTLQLATEGEFDFSLPWKSRFNGDLNYELSPEQGKNKTQLAFRLKGERLGFDIRGKLRTQALKFNKPVELSASVSFDEPDLPLTLTLESPVILDQEVELSINALSAEASLKDLSATVNSKLKTPYWSELGVSLEAQWLDNTLLLKHADIETDNGELSLQGQLINTPEMPFELSVSSTKLALHTLTLLNNKPVIPYPAFIDSQMKLKGLAGGENPQLDLIVSQLGGTLNHKPVSAEGHVNVTSELLSIDKLIVKSGSNEISGYGTSNANNQTVSLNILIPEPELWLPDLKGRIEGNVEGNGQLNKALSNVDINGKLKVSDLTFKNYALKLAQLDFDVKQSAQDPSVLNLSMQNLKLGNITLETSQLQLNGNRANAELFGDLVIQNYGEAKLHCDVKYVTSSSGLDKKSLAKSECDDFSWLSIVYPDATYAWKNKDNISINWDLASSSLSLEPFCLSSQMSEVCNTDVASWSPEKGYAVSVNAEGISLQRQKHRWPALFKLNGLLDASAKVSQKPGETMKADIIFALPKGDISLINTDDSEAPLLQFSIDDMSLSASLHNDQLSLNSHFTSPQLGNIKTQLDIADIGGKQTMTGDVGIDKLDLSYIGSAIPSVTALEGMVSSQLALSGALTKPLVEGDFKLLEGVLKTDYFPEVIRNIEVSANFDQQTLNYKGNFESNRGQATLNGELDWQDQWVLKTSLVSEAFKITPRSGINLTIRPTVSVILRDGEANVSGELNIPSARVEIKALPAGTKSVSSDVRVIGQETEELAGTRWKYNTNVNIILGNDVHFRGFGVNTYLTGNLLIEQTENGGFEGTGRILTEDGFYTIWGQRLTVKEGRFNFNGPLDEPDLQLDATRTISEDNVTVGVRITGSANDPDISFYSQPAMNETSVLHYLLTGQSPDKGSNNSNLLNNMMISGGIFGSSEMTEKLASKVGISDFQIATSSDDDGTSMELSGYISPDIYLKYGVSLYDDAKNVAMRYRLKQNLFIEAASGMSSSLDIIYSFERR